MSGGELRAANIENSPFVWERGDLEQWAAQEAVDWLKVCDVDEWIDRDGRRWRVEFEARLVEVEP